MFGLNPLSMRGKCLGRTLYRSGGKDWVEPSIVEGKMFGSNPLSWRGGGMLGSNPLLLKGKCLGRTLYRGGGGNVWVEPSIVEGGNVWFEPSIVQGGMFGGGGGK